MDSKFTHTNKLESDKTLISQDSNIFRIISAKLAFSKGLWDFSAQSFEMALEMLLPVYYDQFLLFFNFLQALGCKNNFDAFFYSEGQPGF